MRDLRDRIVEQTKKVVVGLENAIDMLLISSAVGGHVLLEGVPGVAKTLLANAYARSLGVRFTRVQFTPDMLPSDLTGTMALRGTELEFRPGPVFTNVLLADEINRTPPKTQAALLEAMQERQVTIAGESRSLPTFFLVVATQNPIEYEGTYPLPEAQLDRFLMKVDVGYPDHADEVGLLKLERRGIEPSTIDEVQAVVSEAELDEVRRQVSLVRASDEVVAYTANVVRATRSLPSVELGASPRAAVHLLAAARAHALLLGRDYVTPDDVAALAERALAHRLVLRPEAELERFSEVEAVRTALSSVEVPR
jgi:MoxR-like ATPase